MRAYLITVLAVLVVVGIVDHLLGTKLYKTKRFWQFMGVVAGLTILVDSYMAGRPIELFNEEVMTGIKFVQAPLENILFGMAMMWLNVVLFEWFNKRK